MDKSINSRAQVIFDLAKRAGLTEDTQADFLKKMDIESLEKELEKERSEFIGSNTDLDLAENIWSQGVESHVDDKLIWQLINYAVGNSKGTMVDWRFTAEDVVANIEMLSTGLDIKTLGEKQEAGNWIEQVLINEEKYDFGGEPGESILRMMASINKHLLKLGKLFIYYDQGTDDMYFLFVNKEEASEFRKYKFTVPE